MNDEIKELIWREVWFGFCAKHEIQALIADNFLGDEIPTDSEIDLEIDRVLELKSANEKNGKPREETSFYKLHRAFDNLHVDGIIALHNAGFTQSEGLDSVSEVLNQVDSEKIIGHCFYTEQDLTRIIPAYNSTDTTVYSGTLFIGFGGTEKVNSERIAKIIISRLKQFNLHPQWNYDIDKRIEILNFTWQKKQDNYDWSTNRSVFLLNEHIPKQTLTITKTTKKSWQFWKK